jgi:SAM-dependent methyltransferase
MSSRGADPVPVSGTEGYAEQAEALFRLYESISFTHAHRSVLHLIPRTPCSVLDIGAGTGRDAAGLAQMGHHVLAVEPTAAFRDRAAVLHASPRIEWLDDSLPELSKVRARGERFDMVMLSAVWTHLDEAQRQQAMPNVANLLQSGGILVMSLRHGPVPPGRRMFDVTAEETTRLAEAMSLNPIFQAHPGDSTLRRPGVHWTRLAFARSGCG